LPLDGTKNDCAAWIAWEGTWVWHGENRCGEWWGRRKPWGLGMEVYGGKVPYFESNYRNKL